MSFTSFGNGLHYTWPLFVWSLQRRLTLKVFLLSLCWVRLCTSSLGFSRPPALFPVYTGTPIRVSATPLLLIRLYHSRYYYPIKTFRIWTLLLSTRTPKLGQPGLIPWVGLDYREAKMIVALASRNKPLSLLALAPKQSKKKKAVNSPLGERVQALETKAWLDVWKGLYGELRLSFCFSLMSLEYWEKKTQFNLNRLSCVLNSQ